MFNLCLAKNFSNMLEQRPYYIVTFSCFEGIVFSTHLQAESSSTMKETALSRRCPAAELIAKRISLPHRRVISLRYPVQSLFICFYFYLCVHMEAGG